MMKTKKNKISNNNESNELRSLFKRSYSGTLLYKPRRNFTSFVNDKDIFGLIYIAKILLLHFCSKIV